jgi:hypothetical protein
MRDGVQKLTNWEMEMGSAELKLCDLGLTADVDGRQRRRRLRIVYKGSVFSMFESINRFKPPKQTLQEHKTTFSEVKVNHPL